MTGNYTINVTLDGEHIEDSPFAVNVITLRPDPLQCVTPRLLPPLLLSNYLLSTYLLSSSASSPSSPLPPQPPQPLPLSLVRCVVRGDALHAAVARTPQHFEVPATNLPRTFLSLPRTFPRTFPEPSLNLP